jgi:hypothetical protein
MGFLAAFLVSCVALFGMVAVYLWGWQAFVVIGACTALGYGIGLFQGVNSDY